MSGLEDKLAATSLEEQPKKKPSLFGKKKKKSFATKLAQERPPLACFFNDAGVEDVEEQARITIERLRTKINMTSTESDELNAMRYFRKFRSATETDPVE